MNFFNNGWFVPHYNFDKCQKSRQSPWDVFSYSSRCDELTVDTFIKELQNTCVLIKENTKRQNKKLGLFLSGGVDSEIIARTLLALDIPFEAFFIQFENKLNDHESVHVEQFVKQTGKKINSIEVDIYKWMMSNEGLAYYAQRYKTWDMATPVQLWARDQISKDYSIISGQYEPRMFLSRQDSNLKNEWVHTFTESSFFARIDHCQQNDFFDYPFFYMYRPELYMAYTKDHFIDKMVKNPYKLNLVSTKKDMMEYYFSEMPVRPKYNGFEKLDRIWGERYGKIIESFGYQDGEFLIAHNKIDTLFNHGN